MVDDSGPDAVPTTNGMPMLGLGTWQLTDPEACAETVSTALDLGYRHVDTARRYGNEAAVGEGLARADVPRDEVFLATKVWFDDLGYGDVLESAEEQLELLGVDAVDLLYVHWPAGPYDAEETLPAFEELRDDGRIDRLAVSNFTPELLTEAVEVTDAPVFANQVECHPLLPQTALRERAAELGVELVAYSPLARGAVFEVPEVQAVAAKHGVSEAQVSLAWLREKGVTAIPKASSEPHLRDNLASCELALDDEDVARIDGIDREERQIDPDFGPWNN